MSRLWIAMLLASSLAVVAPLTAQKATSKSETQSTANTPGVTTITSFDKDHTVIGWL